MKIRSNTFYTFSKKYTSNQNMCLLGQNITSHCGRSGKNNKKFKIKNCQSWQNHMENPRNRADLYKEGVTKNCMIKYLFILKRKDRTSVFI